MKMKPAVMPDKMARGKQWLWVFATGFHQNVPEWLIAYHLPWRISCPLPTV